MEDELSVLLSGVKKNIALVRISDAVSSSINYDISWPLVDVGPLSRQDWVRFREILYDIWKKQIAIDNNELTDVMFHDLYKITV